MKLSANLSLKEVIKSNTATRHGINNKPTKEHLENLKAIAMNVFQPLRNWEECPIGVSSGYRSVELNRIIGGSKTSQHCSGEALDIDADIYGYSTNTNFFEYIKDELVFDQLIAEFVQTDELGDKHPAWIHVSYVTDRPNRKQVLIATKVDGKTQYLPYTEENYKNIYK